MKDFILIIEGDFTFPILIGIIYGIQIPVKRKIYRRRLVDLVIPVRNVRSLRVKTKKGNREIVSKTDSYFWSFFPRSLWEANSF